jgi:hypothetical protein
MTQGAESLNGNGPHTECSAIPVSKEALRIAEASADSVMGLHESFGSVTRAVAKMEILHSTFTSQLHDLRLELNMFGRRLDGRVSRHDFEELKDEFEDSKITNLKHELAKVHRRDRRIFWWVMGIVAAVIVAAITTKLGLEAAH